MASINYGLQDKNHTHVQDWGGWGGGGEQSSTEGPGSHVKPQASYGTCNWEALMFLSISSALYILYKGGTKRIGAFKTS